MYLQASIVLLQELCAVYEEHVTKHERVSLPISIDDTSSTTLDTIDQLHHISLMVLNEFI